MWRKLIWSLVAVSLLGSMGCATTKGRMEDEPWYAVTQELQEDVARLEGEVERLSNENAEMQKQTANLDDRISLLGRELRTSLETPTSTPAAPKTATPTQPATGGTQALYDEALNDYYGRYFDVAIEKFSRLLRQSPRSSLADNAQYWLAECYYGLEDFPRAIEEFQKIFSYAETEKDDDAQLKLGFCYVNMGDEEQAIAEFRKFLNLYPDSEFAGVARRRLEELSP